MTVQEIIRPFYLRGGNDEAWNAREPEILVEGPAGTGKTRTILELLNVLAREFPGLRACIVRKHQVTLTTTCLVTFNDKVLTPHDRVSFFGGSASQPAAYRYPNGSTITVGGMDNPDKVLSSEYDIVYVNEATELTLEDWETLTTRVRPPGALKYQRIIGDCNPSHDKHWLLMRCNEGKTRRIRTYLHDNPAYFDDEGNPTEDGERYLASLSGLTGSRRQRLLDGEWIGMENAVYDLDPSVHLGTLPEPVAWTDGAGGVDYGKVNLSAIVAVTEASDGVVWVRECWTEKGGNLQAIEDEARGMKVRYKLRSGETDPLQEVLAQRLGFTAAKMGAGTRKIRIGNVTTLLDAHALMFDVNGIGVRDLFDEMLGYRWDRRETDFYEEEQPVRKNDDRVAALEYAISALKAPHLDYSPPQVYHLSYKAQQPQPRRKPNHVIGARR